jgi:hypothetical protein
MKIHPVGAEFFHTARQMDGRDEANSRFLQFCECIKKTKLIHHAQKYNIKCSMFEKI